MKKLAAVFTIALSLCCQNMFARKAVFTGEQYDIQLDYHETICPGDAVFMRIKFLQGNKKVKSAKEEFHATECKMAIYREEKEIGKSNLYQVPQQSNRGTLTMFGGVPVSSWAESGNYEIKVTYNLNGKNPYEFTLPLEIQPKEFVSETLELDSKNTAIKTDTSSTRYKQIEKLNAILDTKNPNAFYQAGPFTPPTTATRRTSFFADRRVYKYTNGKSSTNLHYGIDYGVPVNTKVTSCGDGKVVLAEDRVTTGWSVVIEHLPGLYSLYYHMNELNVKEGDMVKQGQQIGLSGATGLATGPHLHWEVRLNMAAVNPDFFTENFTFEN